MRRARLAIALSSALCVCAPALHAQYAVKSPYLQHPELAIGYVDSCASFWFGVYDSVNGGFFTNVDRSGNVITAWGTNKHIISQTRDAYGFARAFMLTGKEQYLVMARRALDYMYLHLWDSTNGGWYDNTDMLGKATGPTLNKSAFNQHYALLGISANFEATRDSLDYRWLMKGYESNERNLWDANVASLGYYDNGSYDWSSRTGKSFNATVDAITTHVLALYLLTGEAAYKTRLLALARNIVDRLVGSMAAQAIGFVESYATDWSWNNQTADYNTRTIMGHVLKSAWCLGRLHELFPDTTYRNTAERLARDVSAKGYDHEFGGPYKDYDRVTGVMYMYGQDTAKAWWQMEQAVTGGLMLYDITGNDEYLRMADESLDFFMKYFVDQQYGEVYKDRTRRGGPIAAWGDNKGDDSKGAYHSTELGYYTYLYGKLFVTKEALTLHYRFDALASDRTFAMNPLECAPSRYRLKTVLRDGTPYSDFSASGRTLHLASGVGGHFTMTYEGIASDVLALSNTPPSSFTLEQNYPNPFNPATTITYRLSAAAHATLVVYDMLGRDVATLVNEMHEPGSYSVTWNAGSAPSGTYFYRLNAGAYTQTRKALLLK